MGCDLVKFKEIYLEADQEIKEALVNILEENGLEGWSWLDKGSRVGCLFYLPDDPKWRRKMKSIEKKVKELEKYNLNPGKLELKIEDISSSSWEKIIEEAEKPRQVLSDMWITPPDYKGEIPEGEVILKMRSGMAFGTGDHASTRLVLGYIKENLKASEKVLDIGTGSGILALTAGSLGAEKVVGIDNDPQAVEIARENVALNNLNNRVIINQGDLVSELEGQFDLILVNILLPEILAVIPQLDKFSQKGSRLILSGLLSKQVPLIKEKAQKSCWHIVDTSLDGEWAGVLLERRE